MCMLLCNPAPRGRGPFGQRWGWEQIKREPAGMGGSDKTNFDKLKFTLGCEAWGKIQEKPS